MSKEKNIELLRSELHLSYLSVSDIYPDDTGTLRRDAVVQVDEKSTLHEIRKLCSSIACSFDGAFTNSARLNGDLLTFVIPYDSRTSPPPPWKIIREDPL